MLAKESPSPEGEYSNLFFQAIRRFRSLSHPIMVDFTNIVDQSKQFPLHIHLDFRSQGKAIQAFLHSNIGKDRFHNSQSPGIDLFALRRADLGFHLFDQVGLLTLYLHR